MKDRIIIHCKNSFQALKFINCHDSHIYVNNLKSNRFPYNVKTITVNTSYFIPYLFSIGWYNPNVSLLDVDTSLPAWQQVVKVLGDHGNLVWVEERGWSLLPLVFPQDTVEHHREALLRQPWPLTCITQLNVCSHITPFSHPYEDTIKAVC